MKAIVSPGGVAVIKEATDLFGENRTVGNMLGTWKEPVHIKEITKEEADFIKEYFEGLGKKVEIVS